MFFFLQRNEPFQGPIVLAGYVAIKAVLHSLGGILAA